MSNFKIAVLPGDGIGPEVVEQAVQLLKVISTKYGHEFNLSYGLIGASAIQAEGSALSAFTLKMCAKSDAVLLGAVGHPLYDKQTTGIRPEDGLLALRKNLGLFANLRPVKVYDTLENGTRFKPESVHRVDFVFIRELTGGIYFGRPKRRWQTSRGRRAVDSMVYSEQEVARIVRVGFEIARRRKKKLVSVDKANVLESSRLWREVTCEVARDYIDITLEHMLVDACAMKVITQPGQFDVLVTENMFGDILTDEASVLAGSLGMLPSASLAGIPAEGEITFGLYEPVHGSAPDIAGKNTANPIAAMLSLGMMLEYSFGLKKEAGQISQAVNMVLEKGYRTADIMAKGGKQVTTQELGELVRSSIENL